MNEIYAFVFSMALGIAARFLYMGASMLSKRANLIPVTIILDILVAGTVGGGFALYIILTGAVIAPYMFACLGTGYFVTYLLTRKKKEKKEEKKQENKDAA